MKKLIVIAALALFLGAFSTPDASAQHRRYGRGYHRSYHHGHYRHHRHQGYRRHYVYHRGYRRGHGLSFGIGEKASSRLCCPTSI